MTRHDTDPDSPRPPLNGPDWRWMLVLGAVLIVGGVLAFLNPFAASLTVVALAGGVFILGGVLQLWIAFQYAGPTAARLVAGLLGLLVLAFGVALIANPLAGIISLTLLIAGFFLAMGVLRIWLGFHLRDRTGWGWLVAAGAVSVLLGLLIVLAMPEAAAGLLGLFLGVDLLSSGVGMTVLALRMR
ncbi:HdeD family acid-resistance protein [Salipiger abyssi]|nr:HdeD family acid-resistance protein [Salipiger abyssi]